MNFTFKVPTPTTIEVPKVIGTYNTICLKCSYTCHEDCIWADNEDKAKCYSMDSSGYCTACTFNCHWDAHKNLPYYYVRTIEDKEFDDEKMRKKYFDAKSEFSEKE